MANPMQVMMSGFVNGGGSMPSNDSSPQSNAYYKFLLDYINEQEKRGYKEHYTNEWAKTAEQLYGNPDVQGGQGLLQDESLDPWSRRGLLMARAAGTSGNPLALESALKMAEASQESFARGGVPSEKMREYELARSQGYEQPFIDYVSHQRGVGPVSANLQVAKEYARARGRELPNEQDLNDAIKSNAPERVQQIESAKQMGEDYAKQYQDIKSSSSNAANALFKMKEIDDLLGDYYTGTGGETIKNVQKLANMLGMNIEGLGEKEASEALAGQLALSFRNPAEGAGMPGSLSDSDREFLMKMVPSLSMTKNGRRKMIQIYEKIYRRQNEIAEAAREYVVENGRLDSGWDEKLSKIRKERLFSSEDVNENPIVEPSKVPTKQRFYNPATGKLE